MENTLKEIEDISKYLGINTTKTYDNFASPNTEAKTLLNYFLQKKELGQSEKASQNNSTYKL